MRGTIGGAILLTAALIAPGTAADQPIFFPVDAGKLVLPYECRAGQMLSWTDEIIGTIGGLRQGAEVRVVYKDGGIGPGRLGAVVCYIGECRGNYTSIAVEGLEPERRAVALFDGAAPFGSLASLSPSRKEETPGACTGLPPQGTDPQGFGFDRIEPLCSTYRPESEALAVSIQIAGHGWMQENGWPVYSLLFRAVTGGAGPWGELGTSTNVIEPSFLFPGTEGDTRVLWTQYEGIGGPAAITFKEMSVAEDGRPKWLSLYQAGGQPCG